MKNILLTILLLLSMSVFSNAETSDKSRDKINMIEIIKDYIDDCNHEGDYYGCFLVALKFEKGEVVEKDVSKAIEYYNKACKLGCDQGCKMSVKCKLDLT